MWPPVVARSIRVHRSTYMRCQDKTLPVLNEFIVTACLVHLQNAEYPSESDTKEHNDYKGKGAQVLASSFGGSAGDHRERRKVLEGWMLHTLKAQINHITHYSDYTLIYDRHAPTQQGGADPLEVKVRQDHGCSDAAGHWRDDLLLGRFLPA